MVITTPGSGQTFFPMLLNLLIESAPRSLRALLPGSVNACVTTALSAS